MRIGKSGTLSNGSLLAKTDARRVTTGYGYDALNRLISKTHAGATGSVAATPSSTYVYDQGADGVTVPNAVGRLAAEYTGPSTAPNTERSILSHDPEPRS